MITDKGMANTDKPFTQYDDTISPTQEDNRGAADDRPIQDNGTEGANFSAGGMERVSKVAYPLPPDPNSPDGKDYGQINSTEISDYGLNETMEVGSDCTINGYGIDGPKGKNTHLPTDTGD